MSELMRPIPFGNLMDWILTEYKNSGTVFGVHEIYRHTSGKTLPIFNEKIETPFGPAAGPHTQLAQNIIAAYVGGSRFFEVKTVQIMDGAELSACVSRPCILAEDEGYNVEWSTELYVPQAFSEYVKAWFAIKLISRELGLGEPDGFVFNMSVGYDLAGIKSEKIDKYIEGMKNAVDTDDWKQCLDWARANVLRFDKVDSAYIDSISAKVCDSITLSTLHGCPPDEIERIASYLINEKGLNTYVKCNPTLLGYEFARKTLDGMGYDYIVFDDHHFNNDLQYSDAVPMFTRLLAQAKDKNVEFGVKLTNTFPVKIAADELPGEEMYMSGKSLYPLSISLAERLEREFDGRLRVSYSGGADYFNIGEIFGCGIWPITMATTLLKTGGYNRQKQIAEKLTNMPYAPFTGVDMNKLIALSAEAKKDSHHLKPAKPPVQLKNGDKIPLVDCFVAGCQESCPINQDIPEYLRLVGEEKYSQALSVICEKNPLPFITGTICPHRCQSGCARNAYEESVHIRSAKLLAAKGGLDEYLGTLKAKATAGRKLAVVGGGPAGMAAAFLAARAGVSVTIFEKRESLGGIVRHVIPEFRISHEMIDNDVKLLEKLGVEIRLGAQVNSPDELKAQGFSDVILAIGAWKPGALPLKDGEALNVLEFLEKAKKAPDTLGISGNVAVIGGGNTAMDAARAAKRLAGVKDVYLVYRRQVRQMPADLEELEMAIDDGVKFMDLRSPVSLKSGKLLCEIMELGEPDPSGRRKPLPTGKTEEIDVSCVISAIGEQVDKDFIAKFGADTPVVGDAMNGPATVVQGIANATAAVEKLFGIKPEENTFSANSDDMKAKRGILLHSHGECDSHRCLGCSAVCESCVDVCPNRANVIVSANGREQVLHVDKMCNECGNCAIFCPYDSAPYRDKLTLFAEAEDFEESKLNQGFLPLGGGKYRLRLNGEVFDSDVNDSRIPSEVAAMIDAVEKQYSYYF